MYVSGFIAPVPEGNKEAYRKMSAEMANVFKDAGAAEVMEAWEEDIEDGKQTDMRMAVKAEPGEKIVFSWIVWPDKAAAALRNRAPHFRLLEWEGAARGDEILAFSPVDRAPRSKRGQRRARSRPRPGRAPDRCRRPRRGRAALRAGAGAGRFAR
jgi:uncharacterized protein YbaA (DUF1428 family)